MRNALTLVAFAILCALPLVASACGRSALDVSIGVPEASPIEDAAMGEDASLDHDARRSV